MQRLRAASQLHVPMHAFEFNRWHVVSPTSQGTSARQPEPSMQNWPLGQRMSFGTCVQRPAIGSQRSSVQATLSSHVAGPPTITQRPLVQRRAFVQRSGAVQSSSMRHGIASAAVASLAASMGASSAGASRAEASSDPSGRAVASVRTVASRPMDSVSEQAANAAVHTTESDVRRSIRIKGKPPADGRPRGPCGVADDAPRREGGTQGGARDRWNNRSYLSRARSAGRGVR
jgi:hypothetical protein